MFDTHCHLNLDPLFDVHETVIKDARTAGISHILIPSTNWVNAKRALEIVENFKNTYMAVGIHPTEKLESINLESVATRIEEFVKSNFKVIAIGEIGLDFYHTTRSIDASGPAIQKQFFESQLRLAVKLSLPVIIHNRLATEDVIDILTSIGAENFSGKAVFHCCPPDETLLEFAKRYSIYIGVDGDVTYDTEKQNFIKRVPSELLLLETDSPYLTPEPARSEKRFPNEPSNLVHTAECVSSLRGEDVVKSTTDNALRLFSVPEKITSLHSPISNQ